MARPNGVGPVNPMNGAGGFDPTKTLLAIIASSGGGSLIIGTAGATNDGTGKASSVLDNEGVINWVAQNAPPPLIHPTIGHLSDGITPAFVMAQNSSLLGSVSLGSSTSHTSICVLETTGASAYGAIMWSESGPGIATIAFTQTNVAAATGPVIYVNGNPLISAAGQVNGLQCLTHRLDGVAATGDIWRGVTSIAHGTNYVSPLQLGPIQSMWGYPDSGGISLNGSVCAQVLANGAISDANLALAWHCIKTLFPACPGIP